MKEDNFINLCKDAFGFLQEDFGFKLSKPKADSFGTTMIYMNSTTGVTVYFEPRENYILLMLHRLVNKKIPEYPVFFDKESIINSYYIDSLIKLRKGNTKDIDLALGKRRPYEPLKIRECLEAYSRLLRTTAADILCGNFSVFVDLERILKEDRVKK